MEKPKNNPPVARIAIEFVLLIILTGIIAYLVYYVHHGLGYLPGSKGILLLYAALAFASGYFAIRIFTNLLEYAVEPKLGVTRTQGIKNVFQIVAGVVLIVVVVGLVGYDLTGILVGAGFLGIVLGLAAQQVLGNIFAGISLLWSRPFEIGERITLVTSSYGLQGTTYSHENELNGFTGTVLDVGIFFTRMTLDNGTPAVYPNSVVIGSMVVNHSRVTLRSTRFRIDIDKRVNFETFKAKLMDILAGSEIIDIGKSTMSIVDVSQSSYQVAVTIWSNSIYEEPIKTLGIQAAITVQKELTPPN